MKIKIYDVADHDVIKRYFGEDSIERPMTDMGDRFGKVIFHDKMGDAPDVYDVLALPDEDGDLKEFVVMARVFYPASNSMDVIVHERHYDEDVLS